MYKVVTENMKSLGLRKNPNIMTFPIGEWVKEPNPRMNNMDIGGIWCTRTLSNAKRLKKYYEEKYGVAKIFECEIARILYENSYRLKTDWVKLIKEIL
jgi:hypothetical protein